MQTLTPSRFDIPAIIFAIVLPTIVTLIYFVLLAGNSSATQQTAYSIGKVIQFGFPVLYVWLFHRWRLKRSSAAAPEIAPNHTGTSTTWLIAIAFGFAVVIAMFVAWFGFLSTTPLGAAMAEQVREKIAGMGLSSVWAFLAVGVFYALFHSFLEEYYWRWFVFKQLQPYVSSLTANVISSLGFMAHHVILLATFFGWDQPLTYIFSGCIACGGFVWAWLYQRGNQLRYSWVSHLVVDAGIFTLGYFIARDLF